ncbi:hypothetical protein MVEN_01113900 [Mycena venus]|uniref:DUF6729 domain-containing protein n=1 Tax=Mycena venus TaxID=2733690 RepID=A0A8H6Y9G5_9AGAR|nr:hypothetical protein MVEN_01113900 [Mycena venus]
MNIFPPAILSENSFNQLTQEFDFLDLNDPNDDVTENTNEEGLFDQAGPAEDDPPNSEADATAAAEETEALKPPSTSILHAYLLNAWSRISDEISAHGQPKCYSRGDLWDRPKHPIFILKDAIVNPRGFKPDALYHLDIFVWLPHLLVAKTELKCECGLNLDRHGLSQDPIARRVRRRPTDYLLMTSRYLCNPVRHNTPGCGRTYQGTDIHIVAQLPRHVQLAFPAYLTTRSAVDKQMMVEVVSLFTSRVGPGPYAELFSETQYHVHAERELMWLAAAEHNGFNNVDFSSFDDPLKYGGVGFSLPALHFSAEEVPVEFAGDSHTIQSLCSEILSAAMEVSGPSGHYYLVAVSIKSNGLSGPAAKLDIIQFRTSDKAYILYVTAFRRPTDVVSCLQSILTSRRIIKIGHEIKQTLLLISYALGLPELEKVTNSVNAPVLDIGKHARLKGITEDIHVSLHTLASIILRRSYTELDPKPELAWSICPPSSQRLKDLAREVDCIWSLYCSLVPRNSVGLPLSDEAAVSVGQLVTVVYRCKPGAEGIIVEHPGYLDAIMDSLRNTHRFNVTKTRSVVKITKVLVAGQKHHLMKQTLSWIAEHGGLLVVATTPADIGLHDEFNPIPMDTGASRETFELKSDETSILDNDSGLSDTDSLDQLRDELQNLENVLQQRYQGDPVATKILDDAFHFMDRLLRLLSKKHSVFKDFAFQFSEAIYIRDKDDEDAVRAVIEKKGGKWSYMIRARADAMNKRIRKFIPQPNILVKRLTCLFNAYKDITCPTATGKKAPFFSDEARKMSERLIVTAQLGYLSDPLDIPLHYLTGRDRDGLNLYRRIRGSNTNEGGWHMPLRRMFGSLNSASELGEALIMTFAYRRNISVGYKNRTGKPYKGHYDLWLRDEIAELAVATNSSTSFPTPRILSTHIATSESFGITPISTSVAETYGITTLPAVNAVLLPHHRDTPINTLVRLTTRPTNQFRFYQIRQRTLHPVLPVCTMAECIKFNAMIVRSKYLLRKCTTNPSAAHEAYKDIDWDMFTKDWNDEVNHQDVGQPEPVTDSNMRIYYKLPQQLERHHKNKLQWTTMQAALMDGANAEALKPWMDMSTGPNRLRASVLPAVELDASVHFKGMMSVAE